MVVCGDLNGIFLNDLSVQYRLNMFSPDEYIYYPHRSDYQPDVLDIVQNLNTPLRQTVISELDSDHLS